MGVARLECHLGILDQIVRAGLHRFAAMLARDADSSTIRRKLGPHGNREGWRRSGTQIDAQQKRAQKQAQAGAKSDGKWGVIHRSL